MTTTDVARLRGALIAATRRYGEFPGLPARQA